MGTLELTEVLEWPRIVMVLRLPLLSFLGIVLLDKTALAGQCMISGDCVITGTVNGEWNDDWGCDNVNACWDEAACCDRVNGNWEYCQNGPGNHMCTTFTDTGKQCCKGDNGGDGTTSGGGGGDYDYADVLGKSILFYEAQRSGYYRGRVSWRGDSATGDRGPGGEDLEGGYYDAGDNLKLHFPFAAAFTFLSWSATSFPDAYNGAGEMDNLKDGIKWATDFMIKCHTAPDTLVAQVGDVDADHGFWGRPEDMNMARPAQSIGPGNPGSDLASDYASALASAYLLFKDSDPSYAATLLDHAKQLLQFAFDHPGKYTDSISTPVYGSSNYYDEMGLAKAWMAKATGDPADLDAANPNVLTGALVGGPGDPNDYYNDARNDFVMNEVALDYNSGFQMAVAGLLNDVAGATTAPPTAPPTDAPTAGPTDGPTDPATTRDPNNNCPGGNLETCISLCPEEDADIYQACVHDCMENC